MKFLILLCVALVVGFMFVRHFSGQPPLQGVILDEARRQALLVSRARPAVILTPGSGFETRTAGWRTLGPKTRRGIDGDARLWFALHETQEGGRLVTALAEAHNNWLWEAAHHPPYPVMRQNQYDWQDETLYESIYQLPVAEDPFGQGMAEGEHVLIYRAKFLLFFRKMQVIAEYREPLTAVQARNARDDAPLLNAFRDRARQCWQVSFPDKAALAELAPQMEKLEPAAERFSRRLLSRWVGEMHWHDDI